MELGEKIGAGAQADVYLSGNGVVKLFKEGYHKASIFYEAAITAMVEATGLPIAKIHEVIKMGDQLAIKMDHISGVSLNECITKDPKNTLQYTQIMAELHFSIHSKTVQLPRNYSDNFHYLISSNQTLDDETKNKLLKILEKLPRGYQLCHCDYHGNNIIKQDDGHYVIDWGNAASGNPDADVCRTYMIYALNHLELAELYLNCYCKIATKTNKDILKWLPIVAAGRLAEGYRPDTDKLMAWIQND